MKRSIHFDKDFKEDVDKLEKLMYGSSIYGGTPKVLRFGVTFTLWALDKVEKVTHDLNDSEINALFSAVGNLRKQRIKLDKIREIEKSRGFVTPDTKKR